MIPYFADKTNWERAAAIIQSWMGTPYRHLWMKKGRGADCALFIGAILMELGVVKDVVWEFYPPDWFINTNLEFVKDTFAQNIATQMAPGFNLAMLPKDTPLMRGDIPGFSTAPESNITNHAGILLDPPTSFVHSAVSRGVSYMNWGNFWYDKMTVIYRVVLDG